MSITYGGVGTVATAVNGPVSPTLPAGAVAGDFLVLFAAIRNSGVGSPDTPAGWGVLLDMGNVKAFGKFMEASTTAPTVTFTGGVANADCQAAITKWGGVSPDAVTESFTTAVLTNASAQNIAYPDLDLDYNGRAPILVAWKQDDATTINPPAGFTGIIASFVTAGDDATLRVAYQIQTTETDVPAASLTVTGGAAAISKAAWLALTPAATFAVSVQDGVYPPRALVSISGLVGGELIDLYRVIAGVRTQIRGGDIVQSPNPGDVDQEAYVIVDAELPFGVAMHWEAVVNNTATYTSQTETITLPGGKVVVSDAIAGLAAEVVIASWPEKRTERRTSVYRLANGKTKVVSAPPAQFTGTIELFTATDIARRNLVEVLENATCNIVQIRQPGGYNDVDCYVSPLSYTVRRYSQDGSDDRRIFSLDVAEVDAWSAEFDARGYTLQDLADAYTGLTLADLAGDYTSMLALAQAEIVP